MESELSSSLLLVDAKTFLIISNENYAKRTVKRRAKELCCLNNKLLIVFVQIGRLNEKNGCQYLCDEKGSRLNNSLNRYYLKHYKAKLALQLKLKNLSLQTFTSFNSSFDNCQFSYTELLAVSYNFQCPFVEVTGEVMCW